MSTPNLCLDLYIENLKKENDDLKKEVARLKILLLPEQRITLDQMYEYYERDK